jgi:2-keto-4-pentenoate hydratase/2-oxohepta-3-ene-1,7-dioic acid hydratase in catechol pathway
MTSAIVQFTVPGVAAVQLGVYDGEVVRRLPAPLAGQTMMELLERWHSGAKLLQALDFTDLVVAADARLLAPLTYPRKVLCAGANYYDHAAEMGTSRPDPAAAPFFFLKTPSTTIRGPADTVAIDPDPAARVDWEVELGVVIGHAGRDIRPQSAPDHIAGYVVANDVSARGLFSRDDAVFPPFGWDWVAHKNQDDSCPIGPGLVPTWYIEDPHDLGIRLSVNGAVKQDSRTTDMVVDIPHLVAAASRYTTLEPGDLILTGTPAGVGMPRGEFLAPGDVVTAEVEGIGSITNTIVARRSVQVSAESARKGR